MLQARCPAVRALVLEGLRPAAGSIPDMAMAGDLPQKGGVRLAPSCIDYEGMHAGQAAGGSRGLQKVRPFQCDIPENTIFIRLQKCDTPHESKFAAVLQKRIRNVIRTASFAMDNI